MPVAATTFLLLVITIDTITTGLVTGALLAPPDVARTLVTLSHDSLITFGVCFLVRPLQRIAGLTERIFVACTMVWLYLVCLELL
jgi:hypothetical protein